MACFNPECVGNCNFERIAYYARRRFVEGIDTITLMTEADGDRERREIALAALLDLDDDSIARLKLFSCDHGSCKSREYRVRLKKLLSEGGEIAAGF